MWVSEKVKTTVSQYICEKERRKTRLKEIVLMKGLCKLPILSAAITTPPLNLTATTLVPVTIGCFVCEVGVLCSKDAS